MLALAVAAGPALFGLSVATTFTDRLVGDAGPDGQLIVLGGMAVTVVLVLTLTRRGVPTSITLALLGAIAGCAVGLGATPDWSRLGVVLTLGAAAPLAGLALAQLFSRLVRRSPVGRSARGTGIIQLGAFTAQSLAYAANDGQKMFAVAAMTGAAAGHPLELRHQVLPAVVIAVVFALGATVSLRRLGRGAGAALLRMRPGHVISAEFAASLAVFGTAGLGAPVSMTQATTGGLIGAALHQGNRSIRWQYAVPLVVAWIVTLPVTLAAGVLVGLGLNGVNG